MGSQESVLVCNYTAIPADQRENHVANATQIFRTVAEVKELPRGYAFRLPNQDNQFLELAEFINFERLCCPFYHFKLEVEPKNGDLWLSLEGGEGVKDMLAKVLGGHAKPEVLEQMFVGNNPAMKQQFIEAALNLPNII
jgi:hypothetical protein